MKKQLTIALVLAALLLGIFASLASAQCDPNYGCGSGYQWNGYPGYNGYSQPDYYGYGWGVPQGEITPYGRRIMQVYDAGRLPIEQMSPEFRSWLANQYMLRGLEHMQ